MENKNTQQNKTTEEVVVKSCDMDLDTKAHAIKVATEALAKYDVEKDIASYIKKDFDSVYSPTWHCIVGKNFGSFVTHEKDCFIYFYIGKMAVLLFKSG